ncbi:B3 domain-containing protein [Hordeum vulgare]|nr:B3 domain-containing protein [Hordeum vulgare]
MEFFTIILEKSSSRQVLPDNFVKMLDGHRPQNMKLRQAGNGLRKLWDVDVVFDTDGSMYLDRGWKQFVRAYDLRHGYFLVFRYDGNATFAVKVFDTTMCRMRYQDDDDAKMEFFTIVLEKSSSMHVLPENFVKKLDGHRPQNMKLRQAGNGLRKMWDVEVAFDTDGSMYDDNATFVVKVFDTTMCRRRYQDDDDASNGSRSSEYCDMCYVYGSSDSGYSKSSSDSGYSKSSSDSGYSKSSSDDGLAMVIPQLGDRAMPILSRRARRIEAGLPASSPKVSDDEGDTTMETGSDDTAQALVSLVHSGFTMEQAQTHYNTTMAKGQPALAPTSALERALEQRRLALRQIDGECTSQEALAGMAVVNRNFVAEQHAIYDSVRAQAAAHLEAVTVPCLRLRLGPTTLAAAGLLRLAALRRRPPASACPRPCVPSVAAPASAPATSPAACLLPLSLAGAAAVVMAFPALLPAPSASSRDHGAAASPHAARGQPPRLTRRGPAAVAHTAGVLRRPSPLSAPP